MNKNTRSILGAVLILLATLSLGVLISQGLRGTGWIDMTSNGRYTLSEGSKNIIDGLSRPLTVKLFFSKKAVADLRTNQLEPFVNTYHYTRDLLAEYERVGGGKLTVEEYDPQPFTPEAEEVTDLGLVKAPLSQDREANFFTFGIAVLSQTGAKEVIKQIATGSEGVLEYEISKAIERVARPKKKKLGVLSSLSILGDNLSPEMARLRQLQGQSAGQSWRIADYLRLDFEVVDVEKDKAQIPADIDILLVVHPKNFSEKTLYAIDQFVLRGGRLIAMVDPFCDADAPPQNQRNPMMQFQYPRGSELNRLLSSWGLRMEPGKVLIDRELIRGGGSPLAPSFTLADGSLNEGEVVNAGLSASDRVQFIAPGALEKVKDTKHSIEALARASAGAGLRPLSGMDLLTLQRNPAGFFDKVEEKDDVLMTAARVTGTFSSAFPDGLPKSAEGGDDIADNPDAAKEEKKDPPPHLKEAKAENTVLVIADVDLIADRAIQPMNAWFRMAGIPENGTFFLNAVDFMGGSTELAKIRGRGNVANRFTTIEEIQQRAKAATTDKAKAIQDEIDAFQKQFQELQAKATEKNVGLLRSEAAKQQRELNLQIVKKKRELNEVKRQASEEEESTKDLAEFLTTFLVPLLVVLVGLGLFVVRLTR